MGGDGLNGSQTACESARSDPASSFTRSRVAAIADGPSGRPAGNPLMTPMVVSLFTKTWRMYSSWPMLSGHTVPGALMKSRKQKMSLLP